MQCFDRRMAAYLIDMAPSHNVTSSSLLSLPNELLLLIRDNFERWDLLAHACYYQVHSRTEACYARVDGMEFWRHLIYHNGLRVGHPVEGPIEVVWREAALEYAHHAWTCTHPACRRERLATNRDHMQKALSVWHRDHGDGIFVIDSTISIPLPDVESNDIFHYINFNRSFPRHDLDEETRRTLVGKCAFLRASPSVDDGWRTADLLEHHPIAQDSFASLPPINFLRITHDLFDEGAADCEFTHAEGVTVHDALTSLATLLDRRLTQDQVSDLVDREDPWGYVLQGNPSSFPSSWSEQDVMIGVRCVGHWFQLFRWTGFLFDCFDQKGIAAFISCEGKSLPAKVQTHVERYAYPRTD
ncbi:hypothetical protein PsYK624_165760 [Phanerochaete sordida]|uniref:Uncharacterized protein n=1 Tax=Phanerochaete sordida TaxID=48140 RepID=A0A9P3GSW0_9APHY|nr:hypothetical protein PsYK624_165760 [Phanerochaete sordida]